MLKYCGFSCPMDFSFALSNFHCFFKCVNCRFTGNLNFVLKSIFSVHFVSAQRLSALFLFRKLCSFANSIFKCLALSFSFYKTYLFNNVFDLCFFYICVVRKWCQARLRLCVKKVQVAQKKRECFLVSKVDVLRFHSNNKRFLGSWSFILIRAVVTIIESSEFLYLPSMIFIFLFIFTNFFSI